MPWAPRSPWEQSEFPRPVDSWAQRVRSSLARLVMGRQTVLPYHRRAQPGDAGFIRVWQYAYPPVVAPKLYPGEAFLTLQNQIDKPHPSGLPSKALVARGG
jgi:hypothetical protein